jgi:hypothetical protein
MRQPGDLRAWISSWWVAAGILLMATAIEAAEGNSRAADRQAIRDAGLAYIKAVRGGDAASLLPMWTPDGDYIDNSGRVLNAHELIRRQAGVTPSPADSLDGASASNDELSMPESSLRFITKDVAIEDGVVDRGIAADGSMLTTRFTAIWVNRDGRWLLDGLREGTTASPPVNEHLQSLDWILGEWIATFDGAEILVSSKWSDGGKFILRDFVVRREGHEAISGTQRLGWDAINGRIKSWSFDSQGGSGEGFWQRDGDRWVAQSNDVSADGRQSTTSAVYTPRTDGHFSFEMTSTWHGEDARPPAEKLPTTTVEFRRAAED